MSLVMYASMQSQNAISAHFTSKQTLSFELAEHHTAINAEREEIVGQQDKKRKKNPDTFPVRHTFTDYCMHPRNRVIYLNAVLMMGKCLRRWPIIRPTLDQHPPHADRHWMPIQADGAPGFYWFGSPHVVCGLIPLLGRTSTSPT